ncbi:Early 94 kDa protein [Eumeta japonica]|uniref:Early 94 kDa protein n=1 Tax=Eumeta variegata TaxID=151549 RepID=A0A4C1UMX9_EUMVA|nr:Early 94 kDa protein [Eumeta japonica]
MKSNTAALEEIDKLKKLRNRLFGELSPVQNSNIALDLDTRDINDEVVEEPIIDVNFADEQKIEFPDIILDDDKVQEVYDEAISTTVCKIGLSSLPLDPPENTSLLTALWYCVELSSCIFKDDPQHFMYERLRMHYGVAYSDLLRGGTLEERGARQPHGGGGNTPAYISHKPEHFHKSGTAPQKSIPGQRLNCQIYGHSYKNCFQRARCVVPWRPRHCGMHTQQRHRRVTRLCSL